MINHQKSKHVVVLLKIPKVKKLGNLSKILDVLDMKVGEAHISEKHCNFFVNKGNAKSKDLENLIHQVKK